MEIALVPFGARAVRLDELGFLQIKKQPFVFRGDDLISPMVRRRFATNVASENSQRVAMVPIAGEHLPNRVAPGEQQGYHERYSQVGTQRRGVQSARCTKPANLRREQQTEWRDNRKNSIDALGWN